MNTVIGFPKPQLECEYPNCGAGVWVGAQVDPLVVFVGVVSELGWSGFGRLYETWSWFIVFVEACAWGD